MMLCADHLTLFWVRSLRLTRYVKKIVDEPAGKQYVDPEVPRGCGVFMPSNRSGSQDPGNRLKLITAPPPAALRQRGLDLPSGLSSQVQCSLLQGFKLEVIAVIAGFVSFSVCASPT